MNDLTLRRYKNAELTFDEMDNNFSFIKNAIDALEQAQTVSYTSNSKFGVQVVDVMQPYQPNQGDGNVATGGFVHISGMVCTLSSDGTADYQKVDDIVEVEYDNGMVNLLSSDFVQDSNDPTVVIPSFFDNGTGIVEYGAVLSVKHVFMGTIADYVSEMSEYVDV